MRRQRRGFTLVELLVVIAIIAVLISILLPALNRARQASQSLVCKANLHQISLGILLYANSNRNWMMPSYNPATVPYWWPNVMASQKYLPNPGGFNGSEQSGSREIWNCPIAKQRADAEGRSQVGWTYARMSNAYPFWQPAGTADWIMLTKIKNPARQIFLIDSYLVAPDSQGAAQGNSAYTNWGMVSSAYTGSGAPGYIHSNGTANLLFSDWHVEAMARKEITQDMCENPDP